MMKRVLSVALSMTILLVSTISFAEDSAIDKLSDFERNIYDAILIMLNDFYNPSEVKILEMGEYYDRSEYRDTAEENEFNAYFAGPDTVVLRLSGTNKLGGTLNHYYELAVTEWYYSDTIREIDRKTKELEHTNPFMSPSVKTLEHIAFAGEYIELSDDYTISENSIHIIKVTESNIGNINRALKEHWSNLGF